MAFNAVVKAEIVTIIFWSKVGFVTIEIAWDERFGKKIHDKAFDFRKLKRIGCLVFLGFLGTLDPGIQTFC